MMLKEPHMSEELTARLNQCSMELAISFANASSLPGAPWRITLANGLSKCAVAADALGLRGLNYLSTLLVPHLSSGKVDVDELSHAELFCNDLIAFCAGLSTPEQAVALVVSLKSWPGLAKIPEQFVEMIGARLQSDAAIHCNVLEEESDTVPQVEPEVKGTEVQANEVQANEVQAKFDTDIRATPVPAPVASSKLESLPYLELHLAQEKPAAKTAQNDSSGSTRIETNQPLAHTSQVPELLKAENSFTVASDELAMLAEACADLAQEVTPQLLSLPLMRDLIEQGETIEDVKPLWDAVFSEYKERIEYFANAASFIGLTPLELWLAKLAENLGELLSKPQEMTEGLRSLLILVPEALQAYFETPSEKSAEQAFMLLEDSAWPQAEQGVKLLATVGALAQVTLIGSRQVEERSDDVSEADVDLRIPVDADVNVVENLLRELPALSTEFSESIERIAKGSFADIEPAQRIAHTLKGSANTVGVRGIANLTHQLEDILQILTRDKKLPPQMLMDHLSDAADCLAEMSEAVAGLGDPPTHALAIYKTAVGWTNRLVRDGVPSDNLSSDLRAEQNAEAAKESLRETVQVSKQDLGLADVPADVSTGAPVEGEALPDLLEPMAEITAPVSAESTAPNDDEVLRVSATLVDRMLGFTGEAAILLAQVQDRLLSLEKTRSTIKTDTERLTALSDELDNLVDIRGLSMDERKDNLDFDALELDEYNELHMVARRIAESSADAKLVDQNLDKDLNSLKDMVAQLERVQTDLRESTLQSRMVQVLSVAPRLQRAARQAGRMANKLVDFEVNGGLTAIDSHLLQTLIDPLTHLIRNAVDHGLESDAVRSRSGKPLNGLVTLHFERLGRNLKIVCKDDGAGLNMAAIRARGIQRGLIKEIGVYTDDEIARLILQPGFSTRDTATQLSGRGVGMDVVFQAVKLLRGTLEISHIPGQGTQFILTLPVRMAAVPVIVARAGQNVIGISVRGIEQILPKLDDRMLMMGNNRLEFDGVQYPAARLEDLLGMPRAMFGRANAPEVVLLVRQEDHQVMAVIAPELSQTRNVIVLPISKYLPRTLGVEGAAVLGDGSVASVVDLPELIAAVLAEKAGNVGVHVPEAAPVVLKPAPVCLIVDDSVSVRRSMEYFVKDLGFEVDSAGDGIEALGKLQIRKPDIMLVDLEMPRMNGIELTAAVRNETRLSKVPVIMITSRFSDKHKQMALAAGVSVFLTKPYTEDDLATHIERCLQNVTT
jgi:chemotaxis protein histidine kinase CheA/CheY-like chemotaxis protein